MTLQGGGTVSLNVASGGGSTYLRENAGGQTLVNQDNTIQGAGVIGDNGLAFTNETAGTVNANASGQVLDLNSGNGGVTNGGLLEATGGGTLNLHNGIDNTGGNITAGDGSTVNLVNAAVTGGTLNTLGSGTMESASGNGGELNNVTLSTGSTYTGALNSATYLDNTITNNGSFQINGGSGNNTFLYTNTATVTLQGGGTVSLNVASGGGSTYLRENAGGQTLVNQDNTIQGAGVIGDNGLAFTNETAGTVNANASGQVLDLNSGNGGVTNGGLLEATGGGTLNLHNGIDNTGGNITAGDGSTVNLVNAAVTGGTLNTLGSGTMESASGNGGELNNVTLSTGSTYTGALNSATYLDNTITNNGSFQINGGSGVNTFLYTNTATVTLQGGGTVSLNVASGGGSTYLRENAGGQTLVNQDNTIQGAGFIGDNGLAFINGTAGTVNANAPGQTLQLGAGGGGVINNGTFAAQAGSVLQVAGGGGTFANFSGNTLSGGSYAVYGTNSNPGTMQINPLGSTGGEIVNNSAAILLSGANSNLEDGAGLDALSNFTNNTAQGSFTILYGRNFDAPSMFTNAGTVAVGAGSAFSANGGGANYTQTGGVTQVDGTLQAAAVDINAGLLKGTGTVQGDVFNSTGGTVKGGDSPGALTITGNYTQDATSILLAELAGTGTGQYSQVLVDGSANLLGTLALQLINGFTFTDGQTAMFDLLGTGGGLTNGLTALSLNGTDCASSGANQWTCNFSSFFDVFTEITLDPGTLVGGSMPQDLVLSVQQTGVSNNNNVPEPASFALLGTGLVVLGAAARRRRMH